ncbi:hypothetical protein MAM1_0397c10302 [Mucor ambiguus]|uniref:Uncharacterized protein n=1 Tax=Mucor ambiguus TaxID=91626 RepID=A0A0C9LY79_9FUNG|nr:hypothetical protein MAM1_0397c10302 [Mucor ambiguus]
MLPTVSLLRYRYPQSAFCLVRSLSTRAAHMRATARLPALTTPCSIARSSRSLLMVSKRPQAHDKTSVLSAIQQQRQFSFWNIPLSLMTASPIKRRFALAALGGAGLAFAIVLGPFLLVGIGGIAAVIGFRLWRMKRDIQRQLQNAGQPLQDWPDFLNAFMQQQQGMGGGVFGKDQRQVETEAMRRLESWAKSSRGRNQLIECGIHPERITQNVSMRGSSYASTSSNITGTTTEIKIELDLRNSPGTILIASAQLDKEGNNLTINDMKLVTATGNVLSVPLSINQQGGPNGGRVIEGEFYDV